jgi:hypothetical protein
MDGWIHGSMDPIRILIRIPDYDPRILSIIHGSMGPREIVTTTGALGIIGHSLYMKIRLCHALDETESTDLWI